MVKNQTACNRLISTNLKGGCFRRVSILHSICYSKGEEFYGKMRLTHGPANRVRQEAESILKDGLANFDVNSITGYKNQFNDVYKEEAYALLNAIVEMFK